MNYLHALLLGIIEGLTEFLPISSTGHMIITSAFLGIEDSQFLNAFKVIVQFGAILSVLVLYWRKFLPNWNFYSKLFLAFLPTALIGFIVKDFIDQLLNSVLVVAWSLIIGGIILIFTDKVFEKLMHAGKKVDDLSKTDFLKLGVFQSIAMIPGVSRSAATILGGLLMGMNRKEAAEFSFFLAVPTMAAASSYKLLKVYDTIKFEQVSILLVGCITAFIVAMLAIKFFIGIVSKYGFKGFGYYRIALGLTLLILIYSNVSLQLL